MVVILEDWVECPTGFARKGEEILTLSQKLDRELNNIRRSHQVKINQSFGGYNPDNYIQNRNGDMFPDEMLMNPMPQEGFRRMHIEEPPEPRSWGGREIYHYRIQHEQILGAGAANSERTQGMVYGVDYGVTDGSGTIHTTYGTEVLFNEFYTGGKWW